MSLQTDLDTIAATHNAFDVGVAVTDLDQGRVVAALNPDCPFQLASIFKIPVLVAAFRAVDAGRLALDARVAIRDEHKLIGSGMLSYLDAGLQPTLRDLLTLMIIVSDNTATDVVLDLLGGPPHIDQVLHDLGIEGITIRHTTRDLLRAVFPADALLLTDAEIARYVAEHDLRRRDDQVAPDAATNTGTPAALNRLLGKIASGVYASAASTDAMLTILKRQTYNQRLPRSWPEDAVFAHKTGTLSDMRGDCGILYHADRAIAISALVQARGAPLPLAPAQQAAGDDLLAEIGAAVFRWAAAL